MAETNLQELKSFYESMDTMSDDEFFETVYESHFESVQNGEGLEIGWLHCELPLDNETVYNVLANDLGVKLDYKFYEDIEEFEKEEYQSGDYNNYDSVEEAFQDYKEWWIDELGDKYQDYESEVDRVIILNNKDIIKDAVEEMIDGLE